MTDALLHRCDTYFDVVPTSSSTVVDTGPLRVFVARAPYPFYVRPRPGADLREPGSVSGADVRDAAEVLSAASHAVSFEWVAELAPELGVALRAAGYTVHHHPLLVRDLTVASAPTAGSVAARLLDADSPDLRDALAVQGVAFGVPGTARGTVGATERDADVVDASLIDYVRARIRAGATSVAVAEDPVDGVVACGWHQPVDGTTEVVGVATLPTHRRRGAAGSLLDVLIADATAQGVTMALLSAGDGDVAKVYEAAGFTRIGHTGAAEPPG